MSGRTLIIGYGALLRGDDGVGQLAAQALLARGLPDTQVVACHQLTPELAESLAQSDLAVFIDAAADVRPGDFVIGRLTGEAPPSGLGHQMDPRALISIAGRLYGGAPEAFLVKVGANSFELGETLSEAVEKAMPAVLAAVIRLVRGSADDRSGSPGEGEPSRR